MQLNFSLKQAWDDLFSSKKYIWQLLAATAIYMALEFLGDIYSIKGPKFLASIIIGGYTSLIAYNVINSKERVLENIFNNNENHKFILLVGLKVAIIESIYLLFLIIPGFPLAFYLTSFHFDPSLATLILMLILSPVLFYLTIFPSIVFAENLNFIDAFNFKKAFSTLKLAWKDYLLCFVITFFMLLGIFILGFVIFNLVILGQNKGLNFNSIVFYFTHLNWSFLGNKLPQNSLFLSFGCFISSYFLTHISAQVYKYTLTKRNKIECNNTIESNEKSMEIDFSIKKAWKDLVESKDSLKYLFQIGGLLIVFSILDVVLKSNIFSAIGNTILGGYFLLMMNNIINNRIPVLENISESKDEDRNIILVILRQIGIGLVYGLGILIIGGILFYTCLNVLQMNQILSAVISIILLLPVIVLVSFSNLLFAENLKFADAFNLGRAYNSLKIAWTKYLTVLGIYFLITIVAIVVLILIAIPLMLASFYFLKSYPTAVLTMETSRIVGGIIGSVVGEISAISLSYWYMNAVAQVYKYSLTKMNITEN